jgi:hypothetical protein
MAIKLKSLIKKVGWGSPDPSLKTYLLENKVVSLSEWLYHGSPYEGLKDMLINGIRGTEHGEVAEHDAFSTSLNSEMLAMFSEGSGETGFQFAVKNAKVIVLDDIMTYLVTQLPGSGMSAEVDDENIFAEFCKRFKIPTGGRTTISYKKTPYLPYGYLSSLGVDAFMYDYVWLRIKRGLSPDIRDESEVCFIERGISKLNRWISGIYIDGHEYKPEEKNLALRDLEERV